MWKHLSEYAENLAEIVAPQDLGSDLSDTAASVPDGSNEDEKEQYISELERALLQRKRYNEQLEREVSLLRATTSQQQEQLDAKQNEVCRLEQRIEDMTNPSTASSSCSHSAQSQIDQDETQSHITAMENHVAQLETKLYELNRKNDEMELRYQQVLLDQRSIKSSATTGYSDDDKNERNVQGDDQLVPLLTQSLLVLTKAMASHAIERDLIENFPDSNEKLAQQLLDLAHTSREVSNALRSHLGSFKKIVLGFFSLHQELIHEDGDEGMRRSLIDELNRLKRSEVPFSDLISFVSSRMGLLSHRINRLQQESSSLKPQLLQKQQEVTELTKQLDSLQRQLDHAREEVASLEQICRDQAQQLESIVASQDVNSERHGQIIAENTKISARLADCEQSFTRIVEENERLTSEQAASNSTREAQMQQIAFELQAQLSACEADKEIALQDAARFEKELNGLERVLKQFQADLKDQKAKNIALEDQLQCATRQHQNMKQWVARDEYDELERSLTLKVGECDRLREALENSAKRFESTDDVLDKRLAAQLVVSYCEGKNTDEVLQLMARMMSFTEDQKARVGLVGGAAANIQQRGGLFGSLFGSSSIDTSVQADKLEGKSLSEMWTAFLLDETNGSK